MRVLFIGPNRVGDAVLATGLLDHLARTYPAARITVACGRPAAGVFAHLPGRERTILIDKQRWDLHWLGLWAWAVRRRWDLVLDLRGSALGFMVRSARRAVMRPRQGHKIAQLAAVLRLDPPPAPVAWIAPEDHRRARSLLPAGRRLIVLGPTANWPPKAWPAASFAALFQSLTAGPLAGALPVVLGGPGPEERALAAPLLALLPGAVDLCGRLSLPEAAACLARAEIFIGNDSGLMHLAAAAGVPTVGVFGPTESAIYGPVGRLAAAVQGSSAAIAEVSVARVQAAAEQVLALGADRMRQPAGD